MSLHDDTENIGTLIHDVRLCFKHNTFNSGYVALEEGDAFTICFKIHLAFDFCVDTGFGLEYVNGV